jgi:sulfate adenylyltransferase
VDLLVPAAAIDELKVHANSLPSLQLSERSLLDLEVLATGALSPLDRFMGREDLQFVLDHMRLTSGHLFPIPVTLPVEKGASIRLDQQIALRDARNELLAVMTVEEIYEWKWPEMARKVFGTLDLRHPVVAEMRHCWGRLNVSGRLQVLQLPKHYDFQHLRLTPPETRARLERLGLQNVVAFQPLNLLQRAEEDRIKRAAEEVNGVLFLHPVVRMTKPGDLDHYTRVRTYKILVESHFDPERSMLSLLPLATRLAGPREALWHALIQRNYGANVLIVGSNHASPLDSTGKSFYGPHEAQELVEHFRDELGVSVIRLQEMSRLPNEVRHGEAPPCFRPEVTEILTDVYPPRHKQGVCLWFTGPSGGGKSTTARALTALLLEHGRKITVLDVVPWLAKRPLERTSKGKLYRKGYVAAEIVRHGGVVIAVTISSSRATRNDIRKLVGQDQFVEVFVDTKRDVCSARRRKRKRRWSLARLLKFLHRPSRILSHTSFRTRSSYEPPLRPEIKLDTTRHTPEENARVVFDYLVSRGLVRLGGLCNSAAGGPNAS